MNFAVRTSRGGFETWGVESPPKTQVSMQLSFCNILEHGKNNSDMFSGGILVPATEECEIGHGNLHRQIPWFPFLLHLTFLHMCSVNITKGMSA